MVEKNALPLAYANKQKVGGGSKKYKQVCFFSRLALPLP